MGIEDLKDRKKQLKTAVEGLLEEFQRETGVKVETAQLKPDSETDSGYMAYHLEIEVELP